MRNLKDKVVLITGAASGIGQASAIRFARSGADVVVSDVNEVGLEHTVKAIEATGRRGMGIIADVSDAEQVKDMIDQTIDKFGQVDVMMNNAGVGMGGEMRDMELKDWEWIVNINLWGPIYGVHYVLPHMIERGQGHIVNVASASGLVASPGLTAYTTTKYGIVGLSEVLRNEIAKYGIGVSVICPGFVRTNIFGSMRYKGWKEEEQIRDIPWFAGISPDTCAKHVVKVVKKNRFMCLLTPEMKLLYSMKKYSPPIYNGIARLQAMNLSRVRDD